MYIYMSTPILPPTCRSVCIYIYEHICTYIWAPLPSLLNAGLFAHIISILSQIPFFMIFCLDTLFNFLVFCDISISFWSLSLFFLFEFHSKKKYVQQYENDSLIALLYLLLILLVILSVCLCLFGWSVFFVNIFL